MTQGEYKSKKPLPIMKMKVKNPVNKPVHKPKTLSKKKQTKNGRIHTRNRTSNAS